MSTIPDAIKPAFDSGFPCNLVSCSAEGTPNATTLSKVYFVDDNHVALSFQFFSKTIRNVRENPHVSLLLIDLANACEWRMAMNYVRSETEGPIFDDMDMAIEAIASMTGMSGIFKLKAADVYEVVSVQQLPFGSAP